MSDPILDADFNDDLDEFEALIDKIADNREAERFRGVFLDCKKTLLDERTRQREGQTCGGDGEGDERTFEGVERTCMESV